MIILDVQHVFRVCGGPRGLLMMLHRHQQDGDLRYNQVQMWQQRKSIPSKWLVAILYCVEREGHRCREFMLDNEEFAVRSRDNNAGPAGNNARPRG